MKLYLLPLVTISCGAPFTLAEAVGDGGIQEDSQTIGSDIPETEASDDSGIFQRNGDGAGSDHDGDRRVGIRPGTDADAEGEAPGSTDSASELTPEIGPPPVCTDGQTLCGLVAPPDSGVSCPSPMGVLELCAGGHWTWPGGCCAH
jgi:hypothetical protein